MDHLDEHRDDPEEDRSTLVDAHLLALQRASQLRFARFIGATTPFTPAAADPSVLGPVADAIGIQGYARER